MAYWDVITIIKVTFFDITEYLLNMILADGQQHILLIQTLNIQYEKSKLCFLKTGC